MDIFYLESGGEIGNFLPTFCRILKKLTCDNEVHVKGRVEAEGEWLLAEINPPIPGTVYGLENDLSQLILKPYFPIFSVSEWRTSPMPVYICWLKDKTALVEDHFDYRQLTGGDKCLLYRSKEEAEKAKP